MKSLVLIPRVMDLFAECRRHPPQVLYLYWGHYPSLLGYLVKRNLSQVRVSMNMGAYDLVFAYPYSIAFSRMADHVWTHARCNLEQLSAIGVDSSRVEVIYKGIDLSSSLMTQESSQKDWLRIVVVSRLSQNKGVDDAIRALWYVTRQLQIDIRMDVIGEGPDLQRLQELARDLDLLPRIRFLGPMRHQDVLSRLRAAGVFLLLSRSPSERLPNALKEAMAMGCISIVSRSPGIEEMTSWNDTLPPVAAGDWEEAGRQLCRVFSELSADELKSMRARGREVISADFDADGTALARMKRWRLPPTQYGSGVAC